MTDDQFLNGLALALLILAAVMLYPRERGR
jgi:hypothetical protein